MLKLQYSVINPDHTEDLPTVILGPPLGTTQAVWAGVAYRLADDFRVVTYDLPGHGADAARPADFTVHDIAAAVTRIADELGAETFHFAGCSISGGVAQCLALDFPARLASVAVLCAGTTFGTPESWEERIGEVVADGTRSLIPDTADRWFAAGFLDEDIAAGPMTLELLGMTNDDAYVECCKALAGYDVTGRLHDIRVPSLFLAGAQDLGNTPEAMRGLADQVAGARFAVIPDAAHLCMVEHPDLVTDHLLELFNGK